MRYTCVMGEVVVFLQKSLASSYRRNQPASLPLRLLRLLAPRLHLAIRVVALGLGRLGTPLQFFLVLCNFTKTLVSLSYAKTSLGCQGHRPSVRNAPRFGHIWPKGAKGRCCNSWTCWRNRSTRAGPRRSSVATTFVFQGERNAARNDTPNL